jgi:hypothetical protein
VFGVGMKGPREGEGTGKGAGEGVGKGKGKREVRNTWVLEQTGLRVRFRGVKTRGFLVGRYWDRGVGRELGTELDAEGLVGMRHRG